MAGRRPTKADIRNDLEVQMRASGLSGKHYEDLLEDYMSLYDTKRKLISDIKIRGAKVNVLMANGTGNTKTNDSIPDLLKVNTQMLRILEAIGVKPAPGCGGEDDAL